MFWKSLRLNRSIGDSHRNDDAVLCFVPLLQLTDAKDKLRAVAKHLEVPEMQVCLCGGYVWGRKCGVGVHVCG